MCLKTDLKTIKEQKEKYAQQADPWISAWKYYVPVGRNCFGLWSNKYLSKTKPARLMSPYAHTFVFVENRVVESDRFSSEIQPEETSNDVVTINQGIHFHLDKQQAESLREMMLSSLKKYYQDEIVLVPIKIHRDDLVAVNYSISIGVATRIHIEEEVIKDVENNIRCKKLLTNLDLIGKIIRYYDIIKYLVTGY